MISLARLSPLGKTLLGLLLLIVLYFFLIPSPIDPAPLNVVPAVAVDPEIIRPFSPVELRFPNGCRGCEDIALHRDRTALYASHESGDILKFSLVDGSAPPVTITRFDHRPIGNHLAGDTVLYVTVEEEGVYRIDLRSGQSSLLTAEHDGYRFRLADDLDVDSNGRVYFSDASDAFPIEELQYDLLEARPHGGLYVYAPDNRSTRLLVDDLHFANGVALAEDESFVLVNETGAFRTRIYYLKGPRTGEHEIFSQGYPGWPDGISRGDDGFFYVTLISPRTGLHDFMLARPWLRRQIAKLPRSWLPAPAPGNTIIQMDVSGKWQAVWTGTSETISSISSVEKADGQLWLGRLTGDGIGTLSVE